MLLSWELLGASIGPLLPQISDAFGLSLPLTGQVFSSVVLGLLPGVLYHLSSA
ncbi:hypothetical protein Pvag_pPag20225 (plasmid) [Pantoea vagans C9-1]|nr:hypothetical protein Pvag_pPag20225 [Pantoea vagans C9-1]